MFGGLTAYGRVSGNLGRIEGGEEKAYAPPSH